ncbi:tyrosine-type recombinase/integrase [Roseibium album]|uniref:tyrosine-type recombinase/integrase n=1 Tax=Roseibium album TaxID=311410 RepID=UPI00391BE72F
MSVFRRKEKTNDGTRYLADTYSYEFQWNGRRFSGSTGKTTKKEALAFEKRERIRVQTPRDDTSIDGAFQRWWEEKGETLSRSDTIFWRLTLLQDTLEDLLARDGLPLNLAEITTNHLARYVQIRKRQPNRRRQLPSPATINREIQLLRMVLRRAFHVWEKDFRLPNFGEVFDAEPEERVVEISETVYEKIRSHMREDYRDVMDFLVLAANRAGNVLVNHSRLLKPEDVDFDNMEITFYVKSKKPGGRRVVLPITQPMLVILANNLDNRKDAVFTYVARRTDKKASRIRGQRYPIALGSFYHEFKRAAAKAGRPELRVHDLRHTGATWVLRKTKNLKVAQKLLGHTRITTTAKYAHVLQDDFRKELEAAHNPHEIPTSAPEELPNPLLLKQKRK